MVIMKLLQSYTKSCESYLCDFKVLKMDKICVQTWRVFAEFVTNLMNYVISTPHSGHALVPGHLDLIPRMSDIENSVEARISR